MLNCSLPIGVTLVADGLRPTKSNLITSGSGVRRDQATWFSGRAWRGTTFNCSYVDSRGFPRSKLFLLEPMPQNQAPRLTTYLSCEYVGLGGLRVLARRTTWRTTGTALAEEYHKQARGITCPRKTRPYRSDDELVQQSEDVDKVA